MVIETSFLSVLAASLAGLLLSIVIERLMTPRPLLVRPWAAWALHAGLWLSSHALLTLVLGRPWFAAAALSAFLLMLVLVNNAKVRTLREPFVFQDYEYFTDAIRHPRLYIPFLGWWKFCAAAAGFALAAAIGWWVEAAPAQRFAWSGQLGGVAVTFASGGLLLLAGSWAKLPVSFEPEADVRALGLLAFLWRYAQEERIPPAVPSPFDALPACPPRGELPHLLAVQSESFFDPRSLYSGIRPEVLAAFDRLKACAISHGKLQVPAWGANTVRTEFAFLTGIDPKRLGVHRFNPYRAIAAGWEVSSLATYLKRLGYRTICIHPYPASFYQRDRVYPCLGFDEFMDIRAFADAERFGPYVSDAAVTEKILDILDQATGPVFIFAITMENHGPLHLETATPNDISTLYTTPLPAGCEDLTIYLRHLRNADSMVAKLHQALKQHDRPASLCWFGDHVPIMPSVYQVLGVPGGEVEYVFWSNRNTSPAHANDLAANDLPISWLRSIIPTVPSGGLLGGEDSESLSPHSTSTEPTSTEANMRHPVAIIGAGRGGSAMLEMFLEEPLVSVVAVVDINADAPGLRLARQHGITTFTDVIAALEYCKQYPNCIVYNLTRDDSVASAARRIFGDKRVAGGAEAKLFWQIIMNLKQLKLDLEKSQNHLRAIIHNVMDGIITLDEAGRIQGCNPAAEKIFGYTQQAIQGQDISLLIDELAEDAAQQSTPRRALLKLLGQRGVEMQGRRHDGTVFPIELSLSEMHLGGVRYFVGIVRDITERKQAEERIAHMARHDFLTGLPNRAYFYEILERSIALCHLRQAKPALLFIDLDGFKQVNDTHGHEVGDLLLQGAAHRLQKAVRKSDVVARIGGDEFVVLLENIKCAEDASVVAQKIIAALAAPFDLNGIPAQVSASIGIALYPRHGKCAEDLLRRADKAMYQAKASGKNTYCFATD